MRLLREPLLHFLLVGALLFAADATLREDGAPPDHQVIRISDAEIDRLKAHWTQQYQRPPAPTELQGLINARVREEVFFPRGPRHGLDEDDSILRRRLAQKLEFLIEDLAATREPTDAEPSASFAAREERYRLPARVSFAQVYFSPDRRGRAAERDASLVLAALRPENLPAAVADQGDPFMMGHTWREQSTADVEAIFGPKFARNLLDLEPGGWSGPIVSAYGWHLVRVEARSDQRRPSWPKSPTRCGTTGPTSSGGWRTKRSSSGSRPAMSWRSRTVR